MDVYRFKELGFRLPAGSGLIKAADTGKLTAADDIVVAARTQAAEIVKDAKEHHESERARGFAEGQKAAQQAALDRLMQEQATLDAGLAKIDASLARLVLATVRKIIHDFDDISLAEALIKSGLTKVRREKRVQIRIPEALSEGLRARVDGLRTAFPHIEFMDIVEDPGLTAPNIVLETAIGRIDCDISAKLTQLEETVTQVTTTRAATDHTPD
ncbi:MAG: hypothetical protein AAFQ09_03070 [Pseudomonadota bacterium]